MEDLQKQNPEQPVPRRRRAVRSVPTGKPSGLPTENTSAPPTDKPTEVPMEKPLIQTEPIADAPEKQSPQTESLSGHELSQETIFNAIDRATRRIPSGENTDNPQVQPTEAPHAVDDVIGNALSDAETTAQFEADSIAQEVIEDTLIGFDGNSDMPPRREKHRSSSNTRRMLEYTEEITVAASAYPSDSMEKDTPRTHVKGGAVLGFFAVLLLIAVLLTVPQFRKTSAVMLYIDDTAVGYLADEQDAHNGAKLVQEHLSENGLPLDLQTLYRCETTAVRGKYAVMSSDSVFRALLTRASEGYVRGYRLLSDTDKSDPQPAQSAEPQNTSVIGVLSETEILSAIDAASAICRAQYTEKLPLGTDIAITPRFTWEAAWIPESAILTEGRLVSILVDSMQRSDAMLSVAATMTETAAERIPYETTLIPNDENFDGIRTMVSPGADGLLQITYTVVLDAATGAEISREENSRTVVREPVSAVSYEGLYPLPDGVSTGSFVWPLPELPDDDLPLDENGNPYIPENTLALKNTYISSGYGERLLWGAYDFHLGLDIVAPAYTEIYAADGGVVVYAAYTSSYGYMTRILHANNVETVYAHQIQQKVKPGDVVQKGQLIGYVGSTGTSSGNHLHLEFRRDHVTVDPLEYITIPEEITILGEGY